MAHPLSILGIAHTLISLAPLAAGLYGFARHAGIQPATGSGRLYLAGLVLSVLTSFGLSSTGGLNPGHVLGVLALAAALGATLLVPRLAPLGRLRPHLQAFGLSFSFFLLLVPGTAETLTRLPAHSPLASGPHDPLVRTALLAWLLAFVAGFAWQVRRIRAAQRAPVKA